MKYSAPNGVAITTAMETSPLKEITDINNNHYNPQMTTTASQIQPATMCKLYTDMQISPLMHIGSLY